MIYCDYCTREASRYYYYKVDDFYDLIAICIGCYKTVNLRSMRPSRTSFEKMTKEEYEVGRILEK